MLFPSLRNRGGFFSDYYLGTVFGGGGRRKSLVTKEVRSRFHRLKRVVERAERLSGDHARLREVLARPLLAELLGYHLGQGEKGIHPLFRAAEEEASGGAPLLLAYIGAFDEDLDARPNGKASATQRLASALAQAKADLRYGLLVTGERIRLIRRRGEGPRDAYLELDVAECLDREDLESLAAALRLFSADAFTPGPDGSLPIEVVERESREHAERVSEDLKRAVFATAERLVQALLDAKGGAPGAEDLVALRDAALTCLYRLLFILYAESRDPRLLANPVYRDSYSLDALVRELGTRGEPPAANRTGLWDRLLALFAIHREGLPGIEGLDPLPARGGELFDPDTPGGRILEEVGLDDATVASVVLDLATTAPRRGVGRERVSFRELDIEQLGAVYEGLLEYEPQVATGTTIEVRVQGRTYALAPGELVRLVREKNLWLRGPPELVAGTEAEELHPEAPTEDVDDAEISEPIEEEPGEAISEGEEEGGVRKGTPAILLRRLEAGRFHFVPGPGRKGSGSFYTPRPLVQDLVRHALGPLVEGRSAAEIESLRVLDPACGSAHFLVEAMRFLGRVLHRAYVEELGGKPPPGFRGEWDTDHEASDEEARAAGSEARAWCKRRVAERCLFGVDLNPTAVQLARVSLWIESLAGDRPLTYFAHHVRCGNSILGSWVDRLGEPPLPELRARGPAGMPEVFAEPVKEAIRKAADLRLLIDRAADEGAVEPETLEEQRFKEQQRRQAEGTLAAARLLFDLRSASAFVPEVWAEWPQLCGFADDASRLQAYAEARPWWPRAREVIARERFFHWELEFPEVFLGGGGFDAVLGNPPFLGGLKISDVHSPEYRQALVAAFEGFGGTADLCVLFYRQGFGVLRKGGYLAMVGTNSIGQGDTRQAGLRRLVGEGGTITMARRFVTWPGEANVEVNLIVVRKGPPISPPVLDGEAVPAISSRLDDLPEAEPARLAQNEGRAFIGDYVRGIGFVLEPAEAERFLAQDPRNADCIFPYLNGEDLNTDPEQRPSRYVICFHDWTLEKAKTYPDLLRTVEERVRPERMKVKQPRDREEWWRFSAYRRELREAIAPLRRVLVRSEVSERHIVSFVPKGLVYSHMLVVFAFDDDYHFALLQSNVHEQWVRREASTMRTDIRYTPTDCFQTFPFPQDPDPAATAEAARIAAAYHEHRRQLCLTRRLGLTQIYNLFHDPSCSDGDIVSLRGLHVEMDRAVLSCYGWSDLDPEHGFRRTDRGQIRFAVSDGCRRELIGRLLELNVRLATNHGTD